ncbi:hypothetical protein [Haloarchaeobius iranensis]
MQHLGDERERHEEREHDREREVETGAGGLLEERGGLRVAVLE